MTSLHEAHDGVGESSNHPSDGSLLVIKELRRSFGDVVALDGVSLDVARNEFFAIAVPAVLPPPTPFKLFVMAAGVFQVRFRYFLIALILGRGFRYLFWGLLAVRYGERSITYLLNNYLQVSGVAASLMLLGWLIMRLAQRYSSRRQNAG